MKWFGDAGLTHSLWKHSIFDITQEAEPIKGIQKQSGRKTSKVKGVKMDTRRTVLHLSFPPSGFALVSSNESPEGDLQVFEHLLSIYREFLGSL